MSKNPRAFCDTMAMAINQCKTDREFIPLARYIIAVFDAEQARRKKKKKAKSVPQPSNGPF